MKHVTIILGYEQKGFFLALGALMSKSWKVRFVVEDKSVASLVDTVLAEYSYELVEMPARRSRPTPTENTISSAKRVESKYNSQLSFLMSQDRALGYGYLVNVEKYPFVKRANWSQHEKLQNILDQFNVFETILTGTDLLISLFPQTIVTLICESTQIPHFHLTDIKYGDRYFWSDDNYQGSQRYSKLVSENLSVYSHTEDIPETPYLVPAMGELRNRSVQYSYLSALRRSVEILISETINVVRQSRKENSYSAYSWLPSTFRLVKNQRTLCDQGVSPNDLKDLKLVYFPLHLEPEVALLQFAPEFNNTVEAIAWLSKSLPADYVLIVKEQATAFAVRSKQFYRRLASIPNVKLADPRIHSWDWINKAYFVATMTGAVGQEAVHHEKPVISFGAHQIINLLPTVFYATSYYDVKSAVSEILSRNWDQQLKLSRIALHDAQIKCSFEMPDYKASFTSLDLEFTSASIAKDALLKDYSNCSKCD